MTAPISTALRVRAVERLSPTLKRLMLEPADGRPLIAAAAGAHVTLTLTGTTGRVLRNAYSLVAGHYVPGQGGSGVRTYDLIVRRTAGARGGSAHVHDVLEPGVLVDAGVPHNLFPMMAHARKHLLIGGGIGITPLLSYLPVLRATSARFELHQIATVAEASVFEALLADYAEAGAHVHAGRAALDLSVLLARQPLGTHVYTCGPVALMEAVQVVAAELGWPAASVHREDFGAATAGGEPFVLTLARSGGTIAVDADETMLEALERAGLDPPSLCRGGVCGECATVLLSGEPDHRDHYLTDVEKASHRIVMPCVSRARGSDLVLDL